MRNPLISLLLLLICKPLLALFAVLWSPIQLAAKRGQGAVPRQVVQRLGDYLRCGAAICILFLSALTFAHSFTATGHMEFARNGHTATLLPNGQVLVTGGQNASETLATAELYLSLSGTFTRAGNMVAARFGHTATLLSDGRVLITGGTNASGTLATAELYHPATGTFTRTGNMISARVGHTATLLSNGKVLVAGGGTATAELFDPSTGQFTAVGNMSTSRTGHTAIRLANGEILVAGGTAKTSFFDGTTIGELFNPATGKFTKTVNGATNAVHLTGTLLGSGKVLIAGGAVPGVFCGFCGPPLVSNANAFLFSGATASFTKTGGMSQSSASHTATLLIGGEVLVTGGSQIRVSFCRSGCPVTFGGPLANAEVYNPASGTFSLTSTMTTARTAHTATLLGNGRVLVAGGQDANRNALASAELYE